MMLRGDRILIAVLLILSVGALLFLNLFVFSAEAETVVIEVDGTEYARYDLREITQPRELKVKTEFGRNTIRLTSDGVSVIESDCRDQLEVKSGIIRHTGQQLICLPNRLVIRLEGKKKRVDGVTY